MNTFQALGLGAWIMTISLMGFHWYEHESNDNHAIAEFYRTESAVSMSPHHVRKHLTDSDPSFILVDVRTKEDYEKEHIVTAVNIPADGSDEDVLAAFRALPKDKDVITYCYSSACMASRKLGHLLAQNGIYVKHLNIGWNEWRYDWKMWNYPEEWENIDVMDYVVSGSEPGEAPEIEGSDSCSFQGEKDC